MEAVFVDHDFDNLALPFAAKPCAHTQFEAFALDTSALAQLTAKIGVEACGTQCLDAPGEGEAQQRD
ncbi:MAG: hypothetical protein BGO00_02025 [Alphaproteobacteria bacterium 62-8]|nr:MAG: hypothetical protein BGO00_02025 [Alphaproteobacteria bacterium 62-8]